MTSVVINPFFNWASDRAPRTPYHETVIYEAHVKGMTQTHPGIPEELRGTYAGLGHPAIIDHLKSLNVTAIELMPVHQFLHDHRLLDLGLRNYWGYNTFGFFAPHYQYASNQARRRRGRRVQDHGAGISRGGHRGDPRRGLQPHRRRQPPRADDQLPRHRQRRLLPAARRRPEALQGLHRNRQQPQRPPPAHPAADHGLAALLGARDARRRVPLRPGLHAGPRVLRRRPAVARSSTWCSRIRWSAR